MLLHNLSMALTSDGVFVCNLSIRFAGSSPEGMLCCMPWSTRPPTGHGVRRRQFRLHITRHSHDLLALNCWSHSHTDHDESHVCLRRASVMLLLESLCQGATMKHSLHLIRWSLHASLPSGVSTFSSKDADGYATAFEGFALPRCLRER